jgi:DNA topoisomerase IB
MPRLHRVECSGPGYTRRRAGKGWVYLDHEGNPLRDEEALDRIRALVIPPAWTSVWICPDPYGHLQAVGTDAAGRRQYLYHPQWRTRRDSKKFDEMLAFAERLPNMRRHVWKLLKQDGLPRERVLAAAVAFLDRGLFRVGGEEYADEHGGYGLATLERRHVKLVGSRTVSFDFVGKAGKRQLLRVDDRWLYRVSEELKQVHDPGTGFLAYANGNGFHDVKATDINAFVKEVIGSDFSAKNFRTWHATVLASVELAGREAPRSETERKRVIAAAVKTVSESLGNTPAVCRASYIDPRVWERYRSGITIPVPKRVNQNEIETSVRALLGASSRPIPARGSRPRSAPRTRPAASRSRRPQPVTS